MYDIMKDESYITFLEDDRFFTLDWMYRKCTYVHVYIYMCVCILCVLYMLENIQMMIYIPIVNLTVS